MSLRRITPWLIATAYLAAIEWLVGWRTVLAAWAGLDGWGIVGGVGLMGLSYLSRAWRNVDYFRISTRPQRLTVLRITLIHNLLNQLLPMRSGEVSFPYLMKRELTLPLAQTGAGLIWFRLLDLHTLVTITLLSFIVTTQQLALLFPFWLGLTLGVWLAFRWQPRWRQLLTGWQRESRLKTTTLNALNGLPENARIAFFSWIWTVVNWGCKLLALIWLLGQFAPAPLYALTTGVVSGELTSVLPVHTPGGIGSYEAGVAAGLSLFGIHYEAALTGAVNVHLFVLSLGTLAGLIALAGRRPEREPQ